MRNIFLVFTTSIVLFFTGCNANNMESINNSKNDSAKLLNQTKWSLSKIDGSKIQPFIIKGQVIGIPTLEFQNGTIFGNSGVNSFRGSFEINNNELKTSMLATTRIAALNPILGATESRILEILSSANKTISLQDDTLIIKSQNGSLEYSKYNPLVNSSWTLTSMLGKNIEKQEIDNVTFNLPTLNISKDTIHGNSGVNSYRAKYILNNNELSFLPIASTMMAAISDNLAKIENIFFTNMQEVKSYVIDNNTLTLFTKNSNLTFERLDFANNFNNSAWELVSIANDNIKATLLENNKKDAQLTIQFKNDTVFGNAGVNRFTGQFALVDRNIFFSPLATTFMLGDSEFINSLEQRYLTALGGITHFELKDHETIVFHGSGESLIFKRIYM